MANYKALVDSNSSQIKRAFSTDRSEFITVRALNGIAAPGVLTKQTSNAPLRIALSLHIRCLLTRCGRLSPAASLGGAQHVAVPMC